MISDTPYKWVIKSFTQPISSKRWFIQWRITTAECSSETWLMLPWLSFELLTLAKVDLAILRLKCKLLNFLLVVYWTAVQKQYHTHSQLQLVLLEVVRCSIIFLAESYIWDIFPHTFLLIWNLIFQISHSSATNITKTQNNQRHSYTVIIIRKMQISGHFVPKGVILYKVDISKCEIVREL